MADIDSLVKHGIYGIGGSALSGMIGQCFVPTAFAISTGTVAAACATGTAILFLPYLLLKAGLNKAISEENNPLTHWILSTTLDVGLAVSAAVLGATILGIAATPIACCALAGMAALRLAALCFSALIAVGAGCGTIAAIADNPGLFGTRGNCTF